MPKGLVKPSTVHREFRVSRRIWNVAVRKKLPGGQSVLWGRVPGKGEGKKEDVDLANAIVWIPDSKAPSGIGEVPLTELAIEALRSQFSIGTRSQGRNSFLPDLRSPIDVRESSERWRRGRRMGHAAAAPRRCRVKGVLAQLEPKWSHLG